MIVLDVPNLTYLNSYRDAYAEYVQNNVTNYGFTDPDATNIWRKFDDYHHERNLKPNRVGADYYWLVDTIHNYFIGEICIRHQLNDELQRCGGHIGYGIRYSEWNKGYGTLMLHLALTRAQELGISPVLVTCDNDNLASARVLEKNGFVLLDKIQNSVDGKDVITRRYQKEL